jgi:5S rRNA maturation endonuclease (ribonuclease M5)
MDFKGSQLKEAIKKIIKEIYRDCIIKNDYFTFSSTKEKSKVKTIN